MSIFWLGLGIIIGLFIPSPVDSMIRGKAKAIWEKVFKKGDTQETK